MRPSGLTFSIESHGTILDAVLRAGILLNYGFSSGNCGDCLAHLVSDEDSKMHPHDFLIKKTIDVLLMCACTAVGDNEFARNQQSCVRSLADALDDFEYKKMNADDAPTELSGWILADHPDFTRCDIYATGPAANLDCQREAALARNLSILGRHVAVM